MSTIYAKTAFGGVEYRIVEHDDYVSVQTRNGGNSTFRERTRLTLDEYEEFCAGVGYEWQNNPAQIELELLGE